MVIYEGQSNENGSPRITFMAPKLVTLECAYDMNIWWGLGNAHDNVPLHTSHVFIVLEVKLALHVAVQHQ
jgi:hypothetical protein